VEAGEEGVDGGLGGAEQRSLRTQLGGNQVDRAVRQGRAAVGDGGAQFRFGVLQQVGEHAAEDDPAGVEQREQRGDAGREGREQGGERSAGLRVVPLGPGQ
jgi:hypothetical protein